MIQDKILFSAWGTKGGADQVVANLSEGLRERGIESKILYHNMQNDQTHVKNMDGEVTTHKSFRQFIERTKWSDYSLINLHSCNFKPDNVRLLRKYAAHVPIVYQAHSLIPHEIYVENRNREGNSDIKKVIELLEKLPEELRLEEMRKYFRQNEGCKQQEAILKDADKIVFLTNSTRDIFRTWFPEYSKDNDREVVIPNSSDFYKYAENHKILERASQIRSEITGDLDSKIIMYSGRITAPKGVSDLAKVFDKIQESYPNSKLLLVGEPPSDQKECRCVYDYIKPEHRKNVVVTGWVSDEKELAAYYAAADIVSILSHHETFCISALESMFMGTPVIISELDGPREVWIEPELAYGTMPEDTERTVNVIDKLFKDPKTAEANAANVQMVVNKKYKTDTILDITMGMYTSAIFERYGKLMNQYISTGDKKSAQELYDMVSNNLPFDPGRIMAKK